MVLPWLVALLACSYVLGYSNGLNTVCEAYSNMGCNQWLNGNRKNCTEPNKGQMSWVNRPVRSDVYSLRSGKGAAGSDRTSYTPGDELSIFLTVNKAGQQYRGVLLHAVNATNFTVGSWRFPLNADNDFWSPPTCPGALMHKSAVVKAYATEFRFKAPPQGTGTITFHCLIKFGPANVGAFYYPNVAGDLRLSEGGATTLSPVYAGNGASCEDVCGPGNVNGVAQPGASNYGGFTAIITPKFGCLLPPLSSCAPSAPFVDDSGLCYYKDTTPLCDATVAWRNRTMPPGAKIICVCGKPIAAAGSRLSVSVLTFLLPLLVFSDRKLLPLLIAGLFLLQGCEAHNWIHTPGRASFVASTIMPCQMRKDSDTHTQIGPTQSFGFKWAMGHDGPSTRIVLIRGEYLPLLDDETIEDLIDDYIADALAHSSPNLAQSPATMRYHGTADNATGTGDKWLASVFNNAQVLPGSNLFIDHPRVPTYKMWSYQLSQIADDVRIVYQSTKYPWILSAARYVHKIDLPAEWDGIHVSMPTFATAGHHVLYWRWNGYTDCTDIDYFSTNVASIYGVQSPGFIWNKIDHCQYVLAEFPWCENCDSGFCQAPISECPVTMLAAMNEHRYTYDSARAGVQAVPGMMPNTVAAAASGPLDTGIPWWLDNCAQSSLTNISMGQIATATSIQLAQQHPIGFVKITNLVNFPDTYLNLSFWVSTSSSPAGAHLCDPPRQPGPYRGDNALAWCHGAVGNYVILTTSAGLGPKTVSMATDAYVARAYPANMNEDTMFCYAVMARATSPVSPEFVVSRDPGDPVFYSTCWVRELNLSWIAPPPPPPPPPIWHYHDKCVDCASFEAIKHADAHPWSKVVDSSGWTFSGSRTPRWRLGSDDQCMDCDRETAPRKKFPFEDYYEVFKQLTYKGYNCQEDLGTCTAGTKCMKKVPVRGYEKYQSVSYNNVQMTVEDCLGYAALDSDCAEVTWSDSACYCWSKQACCGPCRVKEINYGGEPHLFSKKSPNPDPTCAAGTKSANGKLCCVTECFANGVNYCGHTDCLAMGGAKGGGGICCDGEGLINNCTQHGPPCHL